MAFTTSELICTKCSLYKTCENPCIPGRGKEDKPDIMFIGEAPGATEDRMRKVFIGKSGKLLAEVCKQLKIPSKNCYINNVVACRPPSNRNPNREEMKACRPRILKIIKEVKPRVIVLLGGIALKSLLGKTGIAKHRDADLDSVCGVPVYVTYHPAALLRDPSRRELFVQDLRKAKNFLEGKKPTKTKTKYTLLYKDAEVKRFIASLLSPKIEWASCDIETLGLDPLAKKAKLLSIGFATSTHTGTAFLLDKRRIGLASYQKRCKWLNALFNSKKCPKLIGHNFQFDYKYLYGMGIKIDPDNVGWDTQAGQYLLQETYPMPSLKALAASHTDMGNYDEEIKRYKNRMDLLPPEQLLTYNAMDVDATMRIFDKQYVWFHKEPKLYKVMDDVITPALTVLARVELNGFNLDHDYCDYILGKYQQQDEELRRKLGKSKAVLEVCRKFNKKFNPGSSQHVGYLVYKVLKYPVTEEYKTKTGLPSTSRQTLAYFNSRKPNKTLTALVEFSKNEKMLSTYLSPIQSWLHADNKVHSSYNLTRTKTGRLSSERPNGQNFPRLKEIKKIVCPSDGNYILQADYSQVELRVIACAANDKRLKYIYKKGLDAHRMAAASMFNVDYEDVQPEQRQRAKGAVSFGLNYGRSAQALATDMGISLEDAEEFRNSYFSKYKGVKNYIIKMKKFARKHGYVESLFGRRRRVPELKEKRSESSRALLNGLERQSINMPIQSTASDVNLIAMANLQKRLDAERMESLIILTVHDSIVLDVPKTELKKCCRIVKEEMEGLEFDWLDIPLEVDIEIMKSWGELIYEYKNGKLVKIK